MCSLYYSCSYWIPVWVQRAAPELLACNSKVQEDQGSSVTNNGWSCLWGTHGFEHSTLKLQQSLAEACVGKSCSTSHHPSCWSPTVLVPLHLLWETCTMGLPLFLLLAWKWSEWLHLECSQPWLQKVWLLFGAALHSWRRWVWWFSPTWELSFRKTDINFLDQVHTYSLGLPFYSGIVPVRASHANTHREMKTSLDLK